MANLPAIQSTSASRNAGRSRNSLQQTASLLAANVVRAVRNGKGQHHRGRAKDKYYVCGCANREGVSGFS
jgi:hypothetical protein